MIFKNIEVKKNENIGLLKISRTEEKNSLNIETSFEIFKALIELENDNSIRCIIISGDKKLFSPGADIHELKNLTSTLAKSKELFDYFDKINQIKIPIISLVEGFALGGGLELCLMTDFIIASRDAKFGQPEINIGLIPGIGGTQRLKRYAGELNAKYLCMSGEIISSQRAYEMGIVSVILDNEDFEKNAIELVKKMSQKPKSSLMEIKRLINLNLELKEGIKEERKAFYNLLDSKNKKIGIESFFNKKKPDWED
jgi:enoyl-CoA hydratase|tara:strand:+ start:582 stop:1346 length:765 start_codon:yes stop_codon:yes gene_type:complete